MFLLWLRQLPWCGDQNPASIPLPAKSRSSPNNTPVFPPSSFILPSFVWVYIFFSAGQVLLSTLSWCSACTSEVSEGVFLMYPWREVYSTSTYSSAILFSQIYSFLWLRNTSGYTCTTMSLSIHLPDNFKEQRWTLWTHKALWKNNLGILLTGFPTANQLVGLPVLNW